MFNKILQNLLSLKSKDIIEKHVTQTPKTWKLKTCFGIFYKNILL